MLDLTPYFSWAVSQPDLQTILSQTPEERNRVRLQYEVRYFAFLDMAEEEYVAGVPDLGPVADDLTQLLPAYSRVELDLDEPYDDEPGPEIGLVHFDCVQCDYFDANIDQYRALYGDAMDGEHPIDAAHFPTADEQRRLRLVNRAFDQPGDHDGWPRFLGLYMAFRNTHENWQRFRENFPDEGWYAMGLSAVHNGAPVQLLWHRLDNQIQNDFRISTLYTIGAVTVNHLRRVFSLDFAPDLPVPPPVRVADAPLATTSESIPIPAKLRPKGGIKKPAVRRLARQHRNHPRLTLAMVQHHLPLVDVYS